MVKIIESCQLKDRLELLFYWLLAEIQMFGTKREVLPCCMLAWAMPAAFAIFLDLILPYRRYEADQGNFCTIFAGSYKLVWDNSYSTFFRKTLRYKVDAVPPVIEPMEPVAKP